VLSSKRLLKAMRRAIDDKTTEIMAMTSFWLLWSSQRITSRFKHLEPVVSPGFLLLDVFSAVPYISLDSSIGLKYLEVELFPQTTGPDV
jgi:hypothetical protein